MYKLVKSTWQSNSLSSQKWTSYIFNIFKLKRSINIKRCCILGSTTLYSKIQKLQKFRLESCLKKFSQFLVPASTGCFFNSDTFQIHIIKPFLEILKSTKVNVPRLTAFKGVLMKFEPLQEIHYWYIVITYSCVQGWRQFYSCFIDTKTFQTVSLDCVVQYNFCLCRIAVSICRRL